MSSRDWHHHGGTETNKNTLNSSICIQNGTSPSVWPLTIQSVWPLNVYRSKSLKADNSILLFACVFHFILFILLFYFLINHNLGYNRDLGGNSRPCVVNMCLSDIKAPSIDREFYLLSPGYSLLHSFVFFVPAGAVHPAGGVPRRGGSRDGREAQPPVVGGLANAGPRPAQPGRGGPGESVRSRQKKQNRNKKMAFWAEQSLKGEEKKFIPF